MSGRENEQPQSGKGTGFANPVNAWRIWKHCASKRGRKGDHSGEKAQKGGICGPAYLSEKAR